MLKGLAITPPIVGRISIGKVVERQGKRLPEKDDQFTITTQIHGHDAWLLHPFDEALRKAQGGKIRSIPVRLLFNDPDLNFRADYSLFDRNTGRPLCVGNGEQCRRVTEEGIKILPCPAPEGCPLAQGKLCKPYGRLNVAIGDDDPLGTFIFRTTGFNSIRTLAARLHYLKAISGGKWACRPLELKLLGKTTTQGRGTPIYYVEIVFRSGQTLEQALEEARRLHAERETIGFDQAALDEAGRQGLSNGAFEESAEEAAAIADEFFPETSGADATVTTDSDKGDKKLSDKLRQKVAGLGRTAA